MRLAPGLPRLAAGGAAALLGGCSASASLAAASPGVTQVSAEVAATAFAVAGVPFPAEAAALRTGEDELLLLLYGSGSCPAVPTAVRGDGDQVLIDLEDGADDGRPCTDDLAASAWRVPLPGSLDGDPVQVVIDGRETPLPVSEPVDR